MNDPKKGKAHRYVASASDRVIRRANASLSKAEGFFVPAVPERRPEAIRYSSWEYIIGNWSAEDSCAGGAAVVMGSGRAEVGEVEPGAGSIEA